MKLDLGFADDIIEILDYISKKLGIAIDWSGKTILPYLQQLSQKYITYRIGIAILWAIVFSICVLVCIITVVAIDKNAKKYNIQLDCDCAGWWFKWVCICIAIIMFFAIVYNIYIIIECRTFPEKVIFEYIKGIYDSGSYK